MWQRSEEEVSSEQLFIAGERVLPGIYRQVGGNREIRLESEDFLPASLDGTVACYMRIRTWEQIAQQGAGRA